MDMMQQGAAKCGREAWAPMPQYRGQSCHRASPVRSVTARLLIHSTSRRQLGRELPAQSQSQSPARSSPRASCSNQSTRARAGWVLMVAVLVLVVVPGGG